MKGDVYCCCKEASMRCAECPKYKILDPKEVVLVRQWKKDVDKFAKSIDNGVCSKGLDS